MAADPRHPGRPTRADADIGVQVQQITDKATTLIREEIELAKAEVTEKVTKLVKGAIIAAAGGIFAVLGLIVLLHGMSWLAYDLLPTPAGDVYWGFFLIAFLLFALGGGAGYLAAKLVKSGAPPVPTMALEEATRIKQTVEEARS